MLYLRMLSHACETPPPRAIPSLLSRVYLHMRWLILKMRRETLLHLLLAWLLLASSQHSYYTTLRVQARESVRFKLGPAKQNSEVLVEHAFSDWINNKKHVEEKKNRKSPSGPNPVGNQHPPKRQ